MFGALGGIKNFSHVSKNKIMFKKNVLFYMSYIKLHCYLYVNIYISGHHIERY